MDGAQFLCQKLHGQILFSKLSIFLSKNPIQAIANDIPQIKREKGIQLETRNC